MLWIALKFFVLLQSKQHDTVLICNAKCCELLSNFLYFCSRNNTIKVEDVIALVVNCSQIFCTFAVETTLPDHHSRTSVLWIALKFFVLLQSKQLITIIPSKCFSCELLSNFLYFCSRNNTTLARRYAATLWIALKFFVLLQSKQPKKVQCRNE